METYKGYKIEIWFDQEVFGYWYQLESHYYVGASADFYESEIEAMCEARNWIDRTEGIKINASHNVQGVLNRSFSHT